MRLTRPDEVELHRSEPIIPCLFGQRSSGDLPRAPRGVGYRIEGSGEISLELPLEEGGSRQNCCGAYG